MLRLVADCRRQPIGAVLRLFIKIVGTPRPPLRFAVPRFQAWPSLECRAYAGLNALASIHGDGADLRPYTRVVSIRQAMSGGIARAFAAVAAFLLLVMPVLDAGAHAGQAGSKAAAASVLPAWLDVVDDATDSGQKQLSGESGQVHIPLAVPANLACGLSPLLPVNVSWLRTNDERPVRGKFLPNERPPSA